MRNLIYILLLASVCVSCRSIKYVPIESIKHDSIYINRIKYDSIYHKDSIYMLVKGDTVYTYKYKYQYRDKLVRDTVNVTKVDSIKMPYPVEKPLTRWQQIKIELGGFSIILLLIIIIFLIICTILKVRAVGYSGLLSKIIRIFKT